MVRLRTCISERLTRGRIEEIEEWGFRAERISRPVPCSRPRKPARRPRERYSQTHSDPIEASKFRNTVKGAVPSNADGPMSACGMG